MTFFDDKAYAINALIAAVEAIETELGIVPAGVYADVRTRLDILEARINNPFAPSPDVTNPFFIGNTGVTIQAGFGNPNIVLPIPPASPGSVYLQEDGYSGDNVFSFGIDGYWAQVGGSGPSGGIGQLVGDVLAGPGSGVQVATVAGLQGLPVSNTTPTVGQMLTWNGSIWVAQTFNPSPITLAGDTVGLYDNNAVVAIQGHTISSSVPLSGQVLEYNGSEWIPTTQSSNFIAGGDLSGTATSQEVIGILSKPLPPLPFLTDGYLFYNGTAWQFETISGPTSLPPDGPAGGDLSTTYPNPIVIQAQGGDIIFNNTSIEFATGVISPAIYQSNKTTNSGVGNNLTLQAQNSIGTNSIGGNLNLTSGIGTNTDGYVNIQTGGITQLSINQNSIEIFNTGTLLTGNVAISGVTTLAPNATTVNNGSPLVTGTGDDFLLLAAGIQIQFSTQPGTNYFISSITNNTSMTLTSNYTGTNSTTASIINFPNQLYGVGTLFTKQLTPGSALCINTLTLPYIVQSIQSDTQLTLTTNYSAYATASTSHSGVTATAIYVPTILQLPQSSDTPTNNLVIVGQNAFQGATSNVVGGNIILIPGAPTNTSSDAGGSVIISLSSPISSPSSAPLSQGRSGSFVITNTTNTSTIYESAAFSVLPYSSAGARVYIGADAGEYIDAPGNGQLILEASLSLLLNNNSSTGLEIDTINYSSTTTDFHNVMVLAPIQFYSNNTVNTIGVNTLSIHNNTQPLNIFSQSAYPNTAFSLIGTVYINNGSPTLNGTGTFFISQLFVGQTLIISGVNYIVLSIATQTQLTLTTNYSGTTIASPGVPFESVSYLTNGAPLKLLGGAATTNGSFGLRGGVQLQLGASPSETLLEIAEPVLGQRVVALAQVGSGITSAQMPSNTGDGVTWVSNAQVNPTASPSGGFILYSDGGNPYVYTSSGENYQLVNPDFAIITWAVDLNGSTDGYQIVTQITGDGTNEFTSDGYQIKILSTESILGAETSNAVKGAVGGITTTDGVTWTTIFSFTPTGNTGNDWLISLIGLDVTNSPIDGYFYRADLQFTTITATGTPPVLYPATPAPLNVQSNGSGTCSVQVIISSNTVEIQVLGKASTTIDWSGSLQNMLVS
jgi:hypothetical protein